MPYTAFIANGVVRGFAGGFVGGVANWCYERELAGLQASLPPGTFQ